MPFRPLNRVYQTATPRIYDTSRVNRDQARDWIVRTMDDETVFGVELYRKNYVEAVNNGWLSDYRIIALGVNDPEAFRQANLLAANTQSKGKRALTSTDYLRGLAFTLGYGRRHAEPRERQRAHQVLHRLYEHRGQVQEHGPGPPDRRRQGMAARLAARQPGGAERGAVHSGASGRHQQRNRPR